MSNPFENELLEGVRICRLPDGSLLMEGPEASQAEARRLLAEGARYREKKVAFDKTLLKRARAFPLGFRTSEDQQMLFDLADRVEELENLLTKISPK